jgi:hypothetical protein
MAMTVIPFPTGERIPISDPAEIAEIERFVSGLAGMVSACGGVVAIGGRELYALTVAERIATLGPMYDAGEVIVGYRDAIRGEVINLVIEKLAAGAASRWRVEVYREDEIGHALAGAIAEADAASLCRRLGAVVGDGPARAFARPRRDRAGFVVR